jgi:hypothetical protein
VACRNRMSPEVRQQLANPTPQPRTSSDGPSKVEEVVCPLLYFLYCLPVRAESDPFVCPYVDRAYCTFYYRLSLFSLACAGRLMSIWWFGIKSTSATVPYRN